MAEMRAIVVGRHQTLENARRRLEMEEQKRTNFKLFLRCQSQQEVTDPELEIAKGERNPATTLEAM